MVLIVEDDDDIRETLAEMLEASGYEVATAENGERALEVLRERGRPCIVLLDLMMPVMDGWELRRRMLADAALANVPVVVVSGAADLATVVAGLRAASVLPKPVAWPALLAAVQTYC